MTTSKSLVDNFAHIIKSRDIRHLKKPLYEFLHLNCGFIAHYDIHGFIATYSEPVEFLNFCMDLVHIDLEVHQCDTTDDYGHGYTNKEVMEVMGKILTEEELSKISEEVAAHYKSKRQEQYLRLKAEFEG